MDKTFYCRIRRQEKDKRILDISDVPTLGAENIQVRSAGEIRTFVAQHGITLCNLPYGIGAGFPAHAVAVNHERFEYWLSRLFRGPRVAKARKTKGADNYIGRDDFADIIDR